MSVGTTEADHFYFLSMDGQRTLVSLLREIPALVDDLAITICRQDRTGKGGMRISSGSDEQPLPVNMAAADASDDLQNELAGWVRHVCETRGIEYAGSGSIIRLARWLDRNVVALATTEGSDEAYSTIERTMARCRRATDIPLETERVVDDAEMEAARNLQLNVDTIARLAKALGGPCKKLTKRRINYLSKEAHAVEPIRISEMGNPIFLFGDVVDAHVELLAKASA